MIDVLRQKNNTLKIEMTPQDVISLYKILENLNIKIWIDSGWGVDALLGKQLRPHKDLDIAIQWKDMPKLRDVLINQGYKQVREDGQWEPCFRRY